MGGDLVEFHLLLPFSWGSLSLLVVSCGGVNSTRYCLFGHIGDVTLRSFLSLFRIIQHYLRACSSGIVWVETMASPPAAGAANPLVLPAIFSPVKGL